MNQETNPRKKKSPVRRILKWSGITILLLLITAIILPFIFKDKIVELAKAEINKSLNATVSWGDFDLSLITSFPDFRFTINDLRVVGKDVFVNDTLAYLPALKLDLDLMSVIKGERYQINKIILERPRILARVLPDGKTNWDITIRDTTAKPGEPAEPTNFKMSLDEFRIDKGYVVYDDAALVFKTILDDLSYTMSGDFTQDNFTMKNDLGIERWSMDYGGMTYLKRVNTKVDAAIDMDMVNSKYTFRDNEFNFNELGFSLDGFVAMPKEDIDMDLKFKAKQSEFKSFLSLIPGAYTKDFANVKTSGKLAFDGWAKGRYSEKENKMPGYALNLQVNDGFVQYPSVPKPISSINIDCKINDASGIPNDLKIDVNKFHMDFGGNPVDAQLHVATPETDASLNGWLKCSIDLATLKDVMPLEKDEMLTGKVNADVTMKGRMSQIEKEQYDQFEAKGTIAISNMLYKTTGMPDMNISALDLNFTPQFVQLTKFDSKIGKNDLHATGRIDNLMKYLFSDSALLHGNFSMNSAMMDLNEFAGEETATTAKPEETSSEPMSVIEVPANIDFVLNSTITRMIYDNINMDNVAGTIIIRDRKIDLSQLKMNLLGGSMVMNGVYSTVNPLIPKVDFKMNITDFDIQQTYNTLTTIQKFVPIGKFTTGRFSTNMDFKSDLDQTMMPVLMSVNGSGTLNTRQVVIDGFEPLKKLDEALKINKFKKVTLNDINNLTFKIENGRVTTQPFDFKVGNATGQIGGSTGIDQTINYVMNIGVPRGEFGPANAALDGMLSSATSKGIPVKLGDVVNVQATFGGTVTDPTVKVNLKEAGVNLAEQVKEQIKEIVKEKVDSVKGVVVDKACVEADNVLASAKQSAENVRQSAHKAADDAKAQAYAEADRLEKSFKNPLEKAGKKIAADAARKKADDANKAAKDAATKKYNDAVADAQRKHDEKCPPK
ncbi:MAG TPA: AsmA-like C-terminal region-containing protein [Bacteroidia bacterium]|nr:AsmA-like C-terminal region-containing protein [Bacteroidia bacterium]